MKKLNELLEGVEVIRICGTTEREIGKVCFDSRQAGEGDLFVAQRGVSADGHAFIEKAIGAGCRAVVCEELPAVPAEGVTYVVTGDSSEALGRIASNYYGRPSEALTLVGVTGTNGKTTTATLLYELAGMLGFKAGLLSTVCNYIGNEQEPATHTTPDALAINAYLRRMADAGCTYCFMEVSSHSIHQRRIAGLDFDGGIFSNITHDHLDYHKTFRAYIEAKKAFFDGLPAHAFALTNGDDRNGKVMLQNTAARKAVYSCRSLADFNGRIVEKHLDGMLLKLDGQEVWTKFTGDFNAYNLLAVYAAACLLGFDREKVLECVSRLVPVSGRFETLISKEGVMVVVDYAHTPDGLENVLKTAKEFAKGKIITVFGCGGDRDKTKRPIMGETAGRLSDYCLITSDNPRTEDPLQIIGEVEAGIRKTGCPYEKIPDRREAIRHAAALAESGDVILVAGKGHETYQIFPDRTIHFDDVEEVRDAFGADCIGKDSI